MLQISLNELLKKLSHDKIAQKSVLEYFKKKGVEKKEEILLINLQNNFHVYSLLLNGNNYDEYVLADPGNGIVGLKYSAKVLVEANTNYWIFSKLISLQDIIIRLIGDKNTSILMAMELAAINKPKKMSNDLKWSRYITQKGNNLQNIPHDLKDSIREILEAKVKVNEFENRVKTCITKSAAIISLAAEICSSILDETSIASFKNNNVTVNTRDNEFHNIAYVYALYSAAANLIYEMSLSWHVKIDSPFLYIARFHSRLLMGNQNEQSNQES